MSDSGPTIFILGILQRSGTNFLSDLIRLHPACRQPDRIAEDHLLRYVDHLQTYAQLVAGRWTPSWGATASADDLCRSLGDGLLGFLSQQAQGARVVTKTPSVENLSLFPAFFPSCKLVILVRDGRAVVESGMRSFGWSVDNAARSWGIAAQTILDFAEANREHWPRFRIVRFEDLVTDLHAEMTGILEFLELDPSVYDFEDAANLPVRGSSELRSRSAAEGDIHWWPVAKPPEFDPVLRWRGWPKRQHERFNWIAGRYLEAFGYAPHRVATPMWAYETRNRLLDIAWSAGRAASDKAQAARQRIEQIRLRLPPPRNA